MKKLYCFLSIMFFTPLLFSQPWLKNLPQGKSKQELTFYDYTNAFYKYWAPFKVDTGYYFENGVKKRAYGWKQFKRWEYDMESKINRTTGAFPKQTAQEIYEAYLEANYQSKSANSANWTSLGPVNTGVGYVDIGRINCIAFHPTDNNTYWVGAASGGLWVTTNNGSNWTCLTDNNGVLAVSDVIIPTDFATSNTIYIATGDRDHWDNRSNGVLKSTNGGLAWNTTGITYAISAGKMVYRLLADPANNQTLLAATTDGLYKTTNGGTTWDTKLTSLSFRDMEYKPGDFNTLYGTTRTGSIYLSTNAGVSWTQVFTNANARWIELSVSPNQPTWVYAVAAASTSGLFGIYKSTTSGTTFSLVFDGTTGCNNLLGYDTCQTGGQGWYDLAFAVSPSDANMLFVGGISSWKSINGGNSWAIINSSNTHVDKHMHIFRNDGTLFDCNDGGLNRSANNGISWENASNGLAISQMYKLGVSATVSGETITGLQDNGTKLLSGGAWSLGGGDGMECLIDPADVNIQYRSSQNGPIVRTTNHWINSTIITPAGAGTGSWVTPYIIDPANNQTLYAGYADIWKTTNRGESWTKISTMNSSNYIRCMAIAPSNSQYLYVADVFSIWKTTNGGTSWTNIESTLPLGYNPITAIAVKNSDPNTLWVTMSDYDANRVYQSINGGISWVDISAGLPLIPVYSIVQNKQINTDVQLYVGTELGIYLKNGSDNWIPFNSGLPNVKIGEIEIYYAPSPQDSKLRAATFGRGLWQSNLGEVGVLNPIDFSAIPFSTTQINLTWTKNANANNVMVAWSLTNNFGTPVAGTAYTAGNSIPGGGTVIYSGNGSTFDHINLNPNTIYYYSAWSSDGVLTYSFGKTVNAHTPCLNINTLPLNEGFVIAGSIPNCWSQIDHQGNGQVWQFGTITGQSPNPSLSGNYAFLNSDEYGDAQNADLISPPLDLTGYTTVNISFNHYFKSLYGSSGTVSYSINNGSTWTSIATFTTTSLSNPIAFSQAVNQVAGQSQVKFKWNYTGNFAYYWAIDNVFISGNAVGARIVTTGAPSAVTLNTATSGGTVNSAGSSSVSSRGVCWSTLVNPTIADNHTSNGSGTGTFISYLTSLAASTTYHIRAYATNLTGTSYGTDLSFKTSCETVVTSLPWYEGFENNGLIPNCWSQIDYQGNGQTWKFGTITGQSPNPLLSDNYAYLNSDAYGSGNSQKADLISPTFDLTGFATVNLSFNHYFKSSSGSSGTVYYSTNNGSTWTTIATFTTTSLSNPTVFSQAVNQVAGQSLVKFKWNYTGTFAYYWGIDGVTITGNTPVVTTAAAYSINRNTATSGGVVTSAGSSSVTSRGVCWSTLASPSIAGNHTTDGSGTGAFISYLAGLTASTTYHIRAYATNLSGTSYGADLLFVTLCDTISSFPWSEGFENSGLIPNCWTQEQVNTSGINWTFVTGNGTGHPASAHGGTFNACLKDASTTENKTRLITPVLNLASVQDPQLKFWHTQALWSPDQDQLSVYYKTTSGGTWNLLGTYLTSITTWTQETISLPNATGNYYIGFEGNAKYGYGVCLDDVEITGMNITRQLSNITIPNGMTKCYNATQTITVAGNGTTFTVQSGGNTTLIAGQKIVYMPTSSVQSGGYMWGYIAPSGPFCATPSMPSTNNSQEEPSMYMEKLSFKIYPNPSSGEFTIELSEEELPERVGIEIYGRWGEKVLQETLIGDPKHEFSLTGMPVGMYFIRVICGDKSETAKIIKH